MGKTGSENRRCKWSGPSVYAHVFRGILPLAPKRAVERQSKFKSDTCTQYLSSQLVDISFVIARQQAICSK